MATIDPILSPTDQVLEFLLSKPSAEEVIALRPTPEAQERLRYLLDGNRNQTLNDAERAELDSYIQLDNLISRLKARAHLRLASPA